MDKGVPPHSSNPSGNTMPHSACQQHLSCLISFFLQCITLIIPVDDLTVACHPSTANWGQSGKAGTFWFNPNHTGAAAERRMSMSNAPSVTSYGTQPPQEETGVRAPGLRHNGVIRECD